MKPRLTELRRKIIACIEDAGTPQTARSIYQSLPDRPNLSTVYRALDFLETSGYIQSVTFSEATRLYFSGGRHGHFVICRDCHEIQQFDACGAEVVQRAVEQQFDYAITDHVLYFTGLCPDCRTVAQKKQRYEAR